MNSLFHQSTCISSFAFMRPFDVNATIYEIKTIKIYFALSYEGWMSVAIVNLY